jgi:hypothetical protein
MQGRGTVQRDRSRRAAPQPQREYETASRKVERPDPERVIDQMQKEIGQHHQARGELKTAQNGLHPDLHLSGGADVPPKPLTSVSDERGATCVGRASPWRPLSSQVC